MRQHITEPRHPLLGCLVPQDSGGCHQIQRGSTDLLTWCIESPLCLKCYRYIMFFRCDRACKHGYSKYQLCIGILTLQSAFWVCVNQQAVPRHVFSHPCFLYAGLCPSHADHAPNICCGLSASPVSHSRWHNLDVCRVGVSRQSLNDSFFDLQLISHSSYDLQARWYWCFRTWCIFFSQPW